MIKDTLAESLAKAVSEAESKGRLIKSALPEITVDHAQRPEHGDYCSSLPLKLARGQGMPPLEIAKRLVEHLPQMPEVEKVTLAAPGFINFILSQRWLAGQVNEIIGAGERYGESSIGAGTSVQVEFVSVNPTGPLHVGHGRGAVLGSALASVLRTSGHAVTTEYYINDAGSQIEAFYRSLFARYQQHFGGTAEMPSSGYMGTYMVDLANGLANEYGRKFLDMPAEAAVAEIGEIGISRMIAKIKEDLGVLGVSFDVWFREKSLFESGLYNKVIVLLDERGYVSRREGATWFVSTALGESKDNVLVRSDGTPTYFASDIAYHYNKFVERGFDKVIDIWGADHQGHVSRIKAAASALGTDPGRLTVLITQMVALRRGDELVKISKRSGELITLKELIEEVGADACRFFFLSRSADAQMDFDIELAKKQSAENPVYYVQYAHARISSILRFAKEKGVKAQGGDVSMLNTLQELALVRKMLLFPEVVETVARTFQPHHLPYYATELATAFHDFYTDCRVVSEDECLSGARLKLVQAAKIVLARVLHLMGVTAPEQM
ncbi:MAG: arginine--tRNA ligase [Chloroflexi bacterium]|nr:arginine--tRNA ligase [Chloroflexota bacterium]